MSPGLLSGCGLQKQKMGEENRICNPYQRGAPWLVSLRMELKNYLRGEKLAPRMGKKVVKKKFVDCTRKKWEKVSDRERLSRCSQKRNPRMGVGGGLTERGSRTKPDGGPPQELVFLGKQLGKGGETARRHRKDLVERGELKFSESKGMH